MGGGVSFNQAVSTASATSSCAQTLYESEMGERAVTCAQKVPGRFLEGSRKALGRLEVGERAVTCLQRPASSLASLHLCVVRPGGRSGGQARGERQTARAAARRQPAAPPPSPRRCRRPTTCGGGVASCEGRRVLEEARRTPQGDAMGRTQGEVWGGVGRHGEIRGGMGR